MHSYFAEPTGCVQTWLVLLSWPHSHAIAIFKHSLKCNGPGSRELINTHAPIEQSMLALYIQLQDQYTLIKQSTYVIATKCFL